MHLKVVVRAPGKDLRTARPEVGESSDVLLRRQIGGLVKMHRGHCSLLFGCLAVCPATVSSPRQHSVPLLSSSHHGMEVFSPTPVAVYIDTSNVVLAR